MLPTYPAILRDGRLEWGSEGGPPVSPDQPIPVHVTVLSPEPHAEWALHPAVLWRKKSQGMHGLDAELGGDL